MVLIINRLSLVWTILVLILTLAMTRQIDGQRASEEYALCISKHDPLGHYECTNVRKECLPGWKGDRCDQAICVEGCRNGTCELPGTCDCNDGYEGVRCDKCKVFPGCQNGLCNEPWECICEAGWGGIFCDKDLAFCDRYNPCVNGFCHNKGEKYVCECVTGFTGTNCDIPLNDCSSSPCLNNGTCLQATSASNYTCDCLEGFIGANCEVESEAFYRNCFIEGYKMFDSSDDSNCQTITLDPELEVMLVTEELADRCRSIKRDGCNLARYSLSCAEEVNRVLVAGECADKYSLCCQYCKKGLADAFLFQKCPSFRQGNFADKARIRCCRHKIPNSYSEVDPEFTDTLRSHEISEIMRTKGIEMNLSSSIARIDS